MKEKIKKMNSDIQKFFELFIGYDGKSWSINHAKKHNPKRSSYFLYDMQKMIDNQVGYPSVLYLMNTIAFLGYCLNFDSAWEVPEEAKNKNNEFKEVGRTRDFEYFCNKYLKQVNDLYDKLAYALFTVVRHRVSHMFYTHNFITTYLTDRHLRVEGKGTNRPVMWISVGVFFEDTKKAIELIYRELNGNQDKATQFIKRQKFILEWAWKLQEGILNSLALDKADTAISPPDYPTEGVSGEVPQTPPPETY